MVIRCFSPPIKGQALQGYVHDAIEIADEDIEMLATRREITHPIAFNSREVGGGFCPSPPNFPRWRFS